jgi:hypothetical protein
MRAARLACLVLALLAATAVAQDKKDAGKDQVPLPAADDFSKLVLEVVKGYPTDGTHKYYWPKTGSWPGTTRDLFYLGTKVCAGDAEKRCYCCGITFEVFFRAYEKYCEQAKKPFRILDLDAKGIDALRHEWFGPTDKDRTTLQKAITLYKLGREVKLADARAGDFCQLWRHNGSGHSVILLDVVKENGKAAALKYWSAQGSTNGIHENTEKLSMDGKTGVIEAETYLARVGAANGR